MTDNGQRETIEHLIRVCKDGERGFRHAVAHVRDSGRKAVLMDLAWRRRGFAAALQVHLRRFGLEAGDEGTATGALHRGWISVVDAMGHDDAAIVREAARGERAAKAAFAEALAILLPPTVRDLVQEQYEEIDTSLDRVKALLH